jgi:hypothetical protein
VSTDPADPQAEVVAFGMIVPATLVVVERLPEFNFGADWKQVTEYVSDDASIAAAVLRGWDVATGLIGMEISNDDAGRRTSAALKNLALLGSFEPTAEVPTPYELVISDAAGNRTYIWRRGEEWLSSLDSADLGRIRASKLLYVDW